MEKQSTWANSLTNVPTSCEYTPGNCLEIEEIHLRDDGDHRGLAAKPGVRRSLSLWSESQIGKRGDSKVIRGRRNLVIAFEVPDDPMVHCTGRKCPFLPRGVGGFGWWLSSASAETFPRQKSPFQAKPSRDHIVISATGQAAFRLSCLGGRCHQYASLG